MLYLSVLEREKNRPNPTGHISNWKRVLNALVLHLRGQDRVVSMTMSDATYTENRTVPRLGRPDSHGLILLRSDV